MTAARDADGFHRQLIRHLVAEEHDRNVGQHHAQCRTNHDRREVFKPCRQADGRDLRLVTDLGNEEGDECRNKRP
jgi:hypothetical protein